MGGIKVDDRVNENNKQNNKDFRAKTRPELSTRGKKGKRVSFIIHCGIRLFTMGFVIFRDSRIAQ